VEYIKNIIKGAVTGIAMLVPGVSGGTMAIILGIYDRMIHSVSSFFQDWKKNLLFLLQVGAGGVLGVLLFGRIMESAMASVPHIMKFLFMGFIVGGLPVLYRKSVSTGKARCFRLAFPFPWVGNCTANGFGA
jgi:putative membrane protein